MPNRSISGEWQNPKEKKNKTHWQWIFEPKSKQEDTISHFAIVESQLSEQIVGKDQSTDHEECVDDENIPRKEVLVVVVHLCDDWIKDSLESRKTHKWSEEKLKPKHKK